MILAVQFSKRSCLDITCRLCVSVKSTLVKELPDTNVSVKSTLGKELPDTN